jgi:photosystem II stability/assembly factor-like uncharacterized protein
MHKFTSTRIVLAIFFGFQITALSAQWSSVFTGAPGNMNCVSLVGNQIFIGGNQIVKSSNGGANWSVGPLKHNLGFELLGTSLYDIHFFDAQNGVAVGAVLGLNEDIILHSTNGGESWSYAYQGFGNGGALFALNDLFFINNTTGWAVGRNGNIYKTTNAGASWVLQPSGTNSELYSVWFVDANLGFAAGNNVLLKTTNGGGTWSPLGLSGGVKVVFANADIGYVGNGNALYKTNNGGQNWAPLPLPEVNGDLVDLHLIDAQTCYALFSNTVLRSTDGGQSWEETASSAAISEARQFKWLDNQQAVAVGGVLFCWMTTNAGSPYKPIADYSVPQFLCNGVLQTISNETADLPNYTYQWLLDGVLVSTQRNPQILFPDPATDYILRLEVFNGLATDAVEYSIQTILLDQLSAPTLYLSSNPLCQGDQLQLTAQLYDAAFWTLYANGQPTGIAGNIGLLNYLDYPQNTTTYQLHGELVGVCNTAVADVEATVTVTPLPITVAVFAEKTPICRDETTRILIPNSVPGMTYRLYAFFGPGAFNEIQTGNGSTLFFQTPPLQSTQYYELEVSNQNCQRMLGVAAIVTLENLVALLYNDQITGAVGTPIQLNDTLNLIGPSIHWDFGPQAQPPTAAGSNPVFQYTEPGFYTFYVASSGQNNCTVQDSAQIEVFGQNNLPTGALVICEEHPTALLGSETEENENILDVHQTPDGVIYTIGYRVGFFGGRHYNLSIHKLAPDGSELWSHYLSQNEQALDVVQRIGTTIAADEAGNMYITGTYYGSEISLGGQIIYNGEPKHEGFVAKLDPQGELLWHIRMPGFGSPVGVTDLLYVNDQQIYLVAPETPIFEFPDGFKYHFQPGNLLGMIQIDANGHFVRAQSIAQNATDQYIVLLSNFNPNLSSFSGPATTRISPRMSLDKQGRILLVGEYRSPMWAGDQLLTPKIDAQRNGFIVHTDQNMAVLDAFTTYGVADISFNYWDNLHQINAAPAFASDNEGNIMLSFSISDRYDYPLPYRYAEVVDDVVEYGNDSHFLLKYSAAGDLLWHRRNGPLQSPWLAVGSNGNVHALVSHRGLLGLNDADGTKRSLEDPGGRDIALLSWDKNGAVIDALPLGTTNDDQPGWLMSDGCGGLRGLLARNIWPYTFGDSLQYFRLVKFAQTPDCVQVCPFEICQQPQSLQFCRGENANLYVGVSGDDLSYQWQLETTPNVYANLANDAVYSSTQTAMLHIAAAQAPTLAGQQYRCLITNGSGFMITSSAATLLPLDTPLVPLLPFVTPIALDQFASVVAHAQGVGLVYEWQYLGMDGWRMVDLPLYWNANQDSMLIKGYDFDLQNGQQLRCQIFNADGCFVYTTVTTLLFVSETQNPTVPDWTVKVAPSPFTNELHLMAEASDNDKFYWTVYSIDGRKMSSLTSASRLKNILSTRHWPPGVYHVKAECGTKVIWNRVVKVE